MNIQLQPISEKDIPHILPLMEEYYVYDNLKFSPDGAHNALTELLHHRGYGVGWLIRMDDVLVGYAVITFWFSLEFHGRSAFLDELYIREEFRRKGIGSRVIDSLCKYCRENGIHTLRLEVEKKNTAAIEVYRRNGFQLHDRFIMTKRLQST